MSHVNRLFSLNLNSWHVIKGKIDDYATIMYTHCFNIYAQIVGQFGLKIYILQISSRIKNKNILSCKNQTLKCLAASDRF